MDKIETGYQYEDGPIAIKRGKRGTFLFNKNDSFIGRSLDLYGEWAEAELLLLDLLIRPGDVVLDIGANIGTHAVAFALKTGPSGTVHAFEPQSTLFNFLCANTILNSLENIKCHRNAVGRSCEPLRITPLPSLSTSFNFGAVPILSDPTGDRVECITIDSMELETCRLIKIDVEGMEPEVLGGARETIGRHKPILFVENNTIDRARDTIESILALDYRAYWRISPYFRENNHYDNPKNVFAGYQPEANLFCTPDHPDYRVSGMVECTGPDDNWAKALKRVIRSHTASSNERLR